MTQNSYVINIIACKDNYLSPLLSLGPRKHLKHKKGKANTVEKNINRSATLTNSIFSELSIQVLYLQNEKYSSEKITSAHRNLLP